MFDKVRAHGSVLRADADCHSQTPAVRSSELAGRVQMDPGNAETRSHGTSPCRSLSSALTFELASPITVSACSMA